MKWRAKTLFPYQSFDKGITDPRLSATFMTLGVGQGHGKRFRDRDFLDIIAALQYVSLTFYFSSLLLLLYH